MTDRPITHSCTFLEALEALTALQEHTVMKRSQGVFPSAVLDAFYRGLRTEAAQFVADHPEEADRVARSIHARGLLESSLNDT